MTIIDKIRAEIERRLKRENEILWNAKLRGTTYPPSVDNNLITLTSLRDFLDTLQEPENPKGLQSLINEASETAQRIIDRHSFYASLPENLRHKYTEGSLFEILDAISKYGKQEPEMDLEEAPAEIYVTMPGKKEIQDYVGAAWRTQEEGSEHIKYIRADLVGRSEE